MIYPSHGHISTTDCNPSTVSNQIEGKVTIDNSSDQIEGKVTIDNSSDQVEGKVTVDSNSDQVEGKVTTTSCIDSNRDQVEGITNHHSESQYPVEGSINAPMAGLCDVAI